MMFMGYEMKIDWDKWQAIERKHNALSADVDFCREKLDHATVVLRNCDISLSQSVQNRGLFRRHDTEDFLKAVRRDPDAVLASYQDEPISPLLAQFAAAHRDKKRAEEAHRQAESAYHAHGQSYHPMRHWISEQQSKGLLA
jgi:hypothetical protein